MTLTKIPKFCGTPMLPSLSIKNDVGDVSLRQPLTVLSGYGSGSTAAHTSCHGTRIWLREPIARIDDACTAYAYASHRRARAGNSLAQTSARRMAAAAKRHADRLFEWSSAGELGRSATTLFTRRDPLGRNARSFKARGSHRIRALLRASLCKRKIRRCFLSSMDQCRSTQQRGPVCVRSSHD